MIEISESILWYQQILINNLFNSWTSIRLIKGNEMKMNMHNINWKKKINCNMNTIIKQKSFELMSFARNYAENMWHSVYVDHAQCFQKNRRIQKPQSKCYTSNNGDWLKKLYRCQTFSSKMVFLYIKCSYSKACNVVLHRQHWIYAFECCKTYSLLVVAGLINSVIYENNKQSRTPLIAKLSAFSENW